MCDARNVLDRGKPLPYQNASRAMVDRVACVDQDAIPAHDVLKNPDIFKLWPGVFYAGISSMRDAGNVFKIINPRPFERDA